MTLIEKLRSAFEGLGSSLGIVSAAVRKAAEQEQIKTQLMAKHGVETGEILFDSALKLSQEQEMTLQEAADLVEERKMVLDQFADQIQETWKLISTTVQRAWNNLRELLLQEDPKQKRTREVNIRKMRSQRKNWSKWKKRKR
jgi:prophage DNA circulation protein